MQEEWRQFRDTCYYARIDGRIMNRSRMQEVKGSVTKQGYLKVCIWHQGASFTIMVHRVIAECFLPNLESKPTVNHKNGVKSDNRVINLEWLTIAENVQHAYDTGLAQSGEDSVHSILTEAQVLEMGSLFATHTIANIARLYGVSVATVSNIRNGNTWKHLSVNLSLDDKTKYKGNKLSVADIPIIRQMFADGKTDKEIGERFHVHRGSINGIRSGKNWKNY
jgi:hypothetical protein